MRYDYIELKWPILLLTHLLKFKYPDFAYAFFRNEETIKEWTLSKFTPNSQKERNENFDALWDELGLDGEQEKRYCLSIIEEISSRNFSQFDASIYINVNELSRLAEEPPSLTWKEVKTVLDDWTNTQDRRKIENWIDSHVKEFGITKDSVIVSLFEKLVVQWDSQLGQAADALTNKCCSAHLKKARNIIDLLKILGLELNGFVGSEPLFSLKHFLSVLQTTYKWTHFNNTPDYQSQRELEHSFLEQIACKTQLDSISLLEELESWSNMKIEIGNPIPVNSIKHKIALKAAKRVPYYLQNEDISKRKVFAYLVLHNKSVLWESEDLKNQILHIVTTASTSSIVQRNLLELFKLFADELKEKFNQTLVTSEDNVFYQEVFCDTFIIEKLWEGALATPLNPRVLSCYAEIPGVVKRTTGVQLKVPASWNQYLL